MCYEIIGGQHRRLGRGPAGERRAPVAPGALRSGRLPAQEGRNFELILLRRIMHRSLPAERVEALVRRPLGVFGNRVGLPRLGWASRRHWAHRLPLLGGALFGSALLLLDRAKRSEERR